MAAARRDAVAADLFICERRRQIKAGRLFVLVPGFVFEREAEPVSWWSDITSHWDNCAPIMEKLVGPEMSFSVCLSALGEAERRRSARSATSNPDELQRRRRRDHRCEASSTNQLSLRSFLSSLFPPLLLLLIRISL
ncbi:hypothetical protein ABVT39_023557 [Epinephelus coioides]